MTLIDKLKRLQSVHGTSYWTQRTYAELAYMACLSSTRGGCFDDRLSGALDALIAGLNENGTLVKADVLAMEESLADLSADAKSLKVYCVAHAHIDMNWMWGFQETASVTVDTFRTILNLMKEYPDFTFAQSQASTYRIIEKFAPEMIDEIKARIYEGRWEISASAWTETDKNMPNGESLSRHILYTKRYLSNLFDIDPDSIRIDFSPDTFGHNWNCPEIDRNGGIDYYYHMRANDDQPDLYRWRAKSGKEVLVYRDSKSYNGSIGVCEFIDTPLFCQKNNSHANLFLYGVGDHGGGPTRNDVERLMDDMTFPLYPTLVFGTLHKFFDDVNTIRENFPITDREINFVFTGCYTTQTRVKMANRIAEDRSYESEFYAAASTALTGAPTRTEIFKNSWENVLFNHFHDILPGSGIIETREYALGRFQDSLAGINISANSALREIADRIDTSSVPFDENNFTNSEGGGVGFGVEHSRGYQFPQTERGRGKTRVIHLFNSTMYDREEAVEITVWDYRYDLSIAQFTDAYGNVIPHEVLQSGSGYWGHDYTKFLIQAKVPAFGYSTYILSLKEYEGIGHIASAATGGWRDTYGDTPCVLENSRIKAVFDPFTLAMVELTDKATGEQIVTPDKPSAVFRYIKENPKYGMTSWRVGPYMSIETLNAVDHEVRLKDYRVSGMRRYLVYEVKFACNKLTVTAELRGESKIINFHIDVDWNELGTGTADWDSRGTGNYIPQLNFYLPVSYAAKDYKYDIPFGFIDRADIPHDVPGNSFMRINNAGGEPSAFIVTDTKYGFRGHENAGAVTLIRASYDPDYNPERCIHHINIGVGVCAENEQKRLATEYVHPIAFNAGVKHDGGTLPMCGSVAKIADENRDSVMISGVKNGEDGGFIVRVSDYAGKGGKITLTLSDLVPTPSCAQIVDITERHVLRDCELCGKTISFDIDPFAMATLRIK